MTSDCATRLPVGIQILLSAALLLGWPLYKLYVNCAFLQTVIADLYVYVVPPREREDRRRCLWLLMTAAYGLVNSNSKCKVQSDVLLVQLGFTRVPLVPQLFYIVANKKVTPMCSKIFYDLLLAGKSEITDKLTHRINANFPLEAVARGPGLIHYFGLNFAQSDDYSITVDADDKLD